MCYKWFPQCVVIVFSFWCVYVYYTQFFIFIHLSLSILFFIVSEILSLLSLGFSLSKIIKQFFHYVFLVIFSYLEFTSL